MLKKSWKRRRRNENRKLPSRNPKCSSAKIHQNFLPSNLSSLTRAKYYHYIIATIFFGAFLLFTFQPSQLILYTGERPESFVHNNAPSSPSQRHGDDDALGTKSSNSRSKAEFWDLDRSKAFALSGGCLPSFILAGFQKCGTSTLASLLGRTNAMSYGKGKEHNILHPHQSAEEYAKGFRECENNTVRHFDASPEFMNPRANLSRFRKYYSESQIKDVQFVITIRNPIEQLHSHYYMTYKRFWGGTESLKPLNLTQDPNAFIMDILRGDKPDLYHFWGQDVELLDRANYGKHLKRFREYFPTNRLIIILFEHWTTRQKEVLEFVCKNLEIQEQGCELERFGETFKIARNQNEMEKLPFNKITVHRLRDFYEKDKGLLHEIMEDPKVSLFPDDIDLFMETIYSKEDHADDNIQYKLSDLGKSCTEACGANGCDEDTFAQLQDADASIVTQFGRKCASENTWNYGQGPSICTGEICCLGSCVGSCSFPKTRSTCDALHQGHSRICPCKAVL